LIFLGVNYESIKGLLLAGLEKERDFLIELSGEDLDDAVVRETFLDYCRMEDKIYFNHRIELDDFKYSTEFVHVVQETQHVTTLNDRSDD
jgi:hypothetical protein